jgi:hypothetical protein
MPRILPICFAAALAAIISPAANSFAATSAKGLAAAHECAFTITSNKPFVSVSVNHSPPQSFIFDTGCSGGSVIARECADRLGLTRGGEESAHIGAGAGVSVGIAATSNVTLRVGADTLGSPEFRVFSLAHVAPYEGRSVDGLVGEDFLHRHVVEIDYATQTMHFFDPERYVAPAGAAVVPIAIENGLAVASGSMTGPGQASIPCRLVIDTGVRGTVIFYHPFVLEHRLVEQQPHVLTATVGGGAGGETRGDIGRLDNLSLGPVSFARPVAIFSRDTVGVFAGRDPDGIVGGELLRRCRTTFDYPHGRLLLEPYGSPPPFEYDMSGLFLVANGERFEQLTIMSVAGGTPAVEAGLARGDRIVAIDGQPSTARTLDATRAMFRVPGKHRLDVERGGQRLSVTLLARRLV